MISATLGHDIKRSRSEALQSEVEAFLANGGEIKTPKQGETEINYVKQPNLRNYEKERNKTEADARRAVQIPILRAYRDLGIKKRWTVLSIATGRIVSPDFLSHACSGQSSIKDPDVWKKIVEAIEDLKGGV